MLAIIVFIAFWVVLAGGLFLVGRLGGDRAAKQPREPGSTSLGRWAFRGSIAIIYLGFIVVVPAAILIGNHDNASAKVGNIKLTANEKEGRILFGQHCGVC